MWSLPTEVPVPPADTVRPCILNLLKYTQAACLSLRTASCSGRLAADFSLSLDLLPPQDLLPFILVGVCGGGQNIKPVPRGSNPIRRQYKMCPQGHPQDVL